MKSVSISEAKNHLSAVLDLVRGGETVLILDRNKPVARLEPVSATGSEGVEARLGRLERAGLLRRALKPVSKEWLRRRLPQPGKGASALAALLADRSGSLRT